MFMKQKSNNSIVPKRLNRRQVHEDIDWKKSARQGTVEDALVNETERIAFKRTTGDNFIVDAFSRIDRLRQSNKGKHETSLMCNQNIP